MAEMMNAALMYGPGDIRVEQMPKPTCPPGRFVLRVDAVGLCGSDIRNLTTDSRKGDYPFIYGHEVVGTVCETADGVDEYKAGDRIYVYPEAHCLKCEYCRSGQSNLCTDVEHYVGRPGGFAEYISYTSKRVERGATFRVPERISPVRASLTEPLSSAYSCVENINVKLGDTVAILGAGPVGIFLSILSKLRGASRIILIDISKNRLTRGLDFGVDEIINSSDVDPIDAVRDLTHGLGADKAISANPTTLGQQQAVVMTRPGGTTVFFGGVPKGTCVSLDSNSVHYKGLWIYGHYGATSVQVQKAFELVINDKFPAEQVISKVLPLSRINDAIELTRTGEALKVVLVPDGKESEHHGK